MGLRRTASVPLQLCSDNSSVELPVAQKTRGDAALTITAPVVVVPAATTVNGKSAKTRKVNRSRASDTIESGPTESRIAAETAAAATKPLRERALSARTRLSKRVVLAAASATGAEIKVPVAADPQLGAASATTIDAVAGPGTDGMAPALTEPTAVPTTASTKTDSSSPQPEIFAVGESGGFSPPSNHHHHPQHHTPMEGDAENAATNMGGLDGGEMQPMKAPKRPKKDEFPLKELRSTRRRSNLNQTASPVLVVQTNGKTSTKLRWSTGGGTNGGTLNSNSKSSRREESLEQCDVPEAATTSSTSSGTEVAEEASTVEQGDVGYVNRSEQMEATKGMVVVDNNNYLDKNRVPIITNNSAVKDEGPVSVANTNGPESNSVAPPVIMSMNEDEQSTLLDEGQPGRTVDEGPVWIKPNEKELETSNSCSTNNNLAPLVMTADLNCSAAMASDAALLEELVLTTPTNKLTEQLCMVLKDQELALEQQEQREQQQQQQREQQQQQQQEQQQQQSSSSQPSSQTMLKESAEMEQMLGDLAATSELDLLQVFKSFESTPVADDAATGTEGNLLSLLVTEEDVDMIMASTESPQKCTASLVSSPSAVVSFREIDREAQEQELELQQRKRVLDEMEHEMSQMQRRRDFLLRRLRKQQVHHMGRHFSEEVVGLFELSTRAAANAPSQVVGGDNRSFNKVKYLKGNAPVSQAISVVTSSPAEDLVAAAAVSSTATATQPDVEDLTPTSIVMRAESPPLKGRDMKAAGNQTAVGHHPFIKPPSPKSICSFVKKVVATSAGLQPQTTVGSATNSNNNCSFKSNSASVNKVRLGLLGFGNASMLDDGHRLQLTNNVGLLKTELRVVEQAIDSEATASSSGGESADELINYSNSVQESLAIANRAAWRWAQERARLASRWNWLTAEISDLEYRIRQHTELHNQLRKSKGPILLLRPASDDKDGAVTHETDVSAAAAAAVAQAITPTSVNGYRGVLPGQYSSAKSFENLPGTDGFAADVENDVEGTSSRTRPYQRTAFKRRKLVQTMNLHTISKKAARPSSIKCGCQWPQQPCALCTGRSDPTIPRPLPDMIPRGHRAALLDPGFHPCLSFPDDISQSIRCEAVMADPQWQHKVLKASKTALKSSIVAAAAAAGGTYKGHKLSKKDDAKKAGKKYTQGLLSRYKKSKNKSRGTHTKYVHLLKQQKSRKAALKAGLGVPLSTHGGVSCMSSVDAGEYESGVARSRNASPTHHYYRQDRIERRSRNSYDIDNIVIPYSVAASTRVELLPYKEIPTPKWKLVNETDLDEDIQVETLHYQQQQQQAASSDSNSSTITALEFDSEEYLEDYIQEKHSRALLEERKKFSTFLKFPYSTRSRANRRIDSRAESSGANTPDPASPAPNTPSIGGDQESIPSPMCPSTPALESVLESETSSQGPLCSGSVTMAAANRIVNNERRRTISLKMLNHQNSTASDSGTCRPRSQTPEPTGPQFEKLSYPLSDRKYEDMLKQMPVNHERLDEIVNQSEARGSIARVESVSSDSTGLAKKPPVEATQVWDPAVDPIESTAETSLVPDDSDTESLDSIPPEDPNDPEWANESS